MIRTQDVTDWERTTGGATSWTTAAASENEQPVADTNGHNTLRRRSGSVAFPRKLRPPAGRSRDGTAAAQTLAYNYPIYYAKHQLSYRRAIHTRINRIGTVCTMPWTFRIPRSNGIATRAGPRLPCPSQYTRHTVGRPGNNSSAERSSTMRHHQTNGALTATASIRY